MTMSNMHALAFALIPGQVEALERHSNYAGNLAWYGMSKGVKYSRNILFVGIAVTVIAAKCAKTSHDKNKKIRKYACASVAVLGAGITLIATKRLHYFTKMIQN